MRTSLFLSSLFAVSLVGGAAFAETPHGVTRSPNTIDQSRNHGDTVDKTYKGATEHVATGAKTAEPLPAAAQTSKSPTSARTSSRINCSLDSADCAAASHAREGSAPTAKGAAQHNSAKNPFDQKENERVNCNEGDECSASSKGSKAIWSKHQQGANAGEPASVVHQAMASVDRKMNQAPAARMECNEGEECSFSSKEAAKLWRTESFKHGTINSSSKANEFGNSSKAQKEAMKASHYNTTSDKNEKGEPDTHH